MKDLLLKENGDVRVDLIVSMAINTANAATAALEKANRLIELMFSNIDRYDKELYKSKMKVEELKLDLTETRNRVYDLSSELDEAKKAAESDGGKKA